ncbi:MAG TPA: NTP transferase domain-containing protein, partial [Thermoanaerobaculia bacterium]|nr:NTP transferase domain-containing protein [Thermoanaerobaculia bacterium]
MKKGPPSKKRRPAAARAARPSVILLATGAGMNLRSSRPGVLHRVGGRTLLEASLETCAALSPARTVVVIGPARREIEDLLAGRPVTLLVQDPPAGTADAARRAIGVLPRSTSAVLVLRADVPLLRAETVRGLVRRQREGRLDLTALSYRAPDGNESARAGVYCFAMRALEKALGGLAGAARRQSDADLSAAADLLEGEGRIEAVEAG